jgi:hypothetical protein
MTLGLVVGAMIVARPITVYDVRLDVHTLLYCGAAVLLGFQLVTYSIVLRFLMVAARLLPDAGLARRVGDNLRLEHGLSVGLVFIMAGLGGVLWLFRVWQAGSFGDLDPFLTMRIAIPSATAITLGLQVAFAALFISLAKWHVRARASG